MCGGSREALAIECLLYLVKILLGLAEFVLGLTMHNITVDDGDRTPKKAGFSKEGTLGPSLGRTLIVKTLKAAFPVKFRPKLCPKVPSLLKPAVLGVRSP